MTGCLPSQPGCTPGSGEEGEKAGVLQTNLSLPLPVLAKHCSLGSAQPMTSCISRRRRARIRSVSHTLERHLHSRCIYSSQPCPAALHKPSLQDTPSDPSPLPSCVALRHATGCSGRAGAGRRGHSILLADNQIRRKNDILTPAIRSSTVLSCAHKILHISLLLVFRDYGG